MTHPQGIHLLLGLLAWTLRDCSWASNSIKENPPLKKKTRHIFHNLIN